eukprot:gene1114-2165_t
MLQLPGIMSFISPHRLHSLEPMSNAIMMPRFLYNSQIANKPDNPPLYMSMSLSSISGQIRGFQSVVVAILVKIVKIFVTSDIRINNSVIGAWILAYVSMSTVRSAELRDRLSGNTFKLLNMGLFLSFFTILVDASYSVPSNGSSIALLLLQFGYIGMLVSFILEAVRIFSKCGPPIVRLNMNNVLSASYMVSAVFAFVSGCATRVSLLLPYHLSLPSWLVLTGYQCALGLRCFLFPAALTALSGAAAIGPKRLSSQTYQWLNAAIIVDCMLALEGGASLRRMGLPLVLTGKKVLPTTILTLLAAITGYVRGALYKEKPKDK